ncbi:MAG TPA: prolipoprotein diacylglyceryl transferase [bacterium]|nr:prolipoprotein diacylglyceryl transferase [bacterium]HOL35521.1 prolipoprotein diacylglyceryl transferase [bacterium]HPP08514.1 prolipoprotein diacylglyceryl transferase [bacterium]
MHPVCLKIGNFVIYWYGVFVALGIIVSSFVFQLKARKTGYSDEISGKIIFYTVLSGIIGARIVHVLAYFHYYMRNPVEIIMLRNGGLAIQGGILAGLLGLIYISKKLNVNVRQNLDMVASVVPLGQAIGRIGCLFHGCCYGKPSTHWFSIKFPFLETRVHPTEIYYFIGDLAIFFLLYLFSRDKHQDGEIAAWYLIFFGSLRYWIDHFRGDLIPGMFGFYQTQIYGIICFLIGAFWIFRLFFANQKMI